MLPLRERGGWEWGKIKRIINLGIFLAISELAFSKTMRNKAALKNGLIEHISKLFTIQVQVDFDREILGNFYPNKYEAALR